MIGDSHYDHIGRKCDWLLHLGKVSLDEQASFKRHVSCRAIRLDYTAGFLANAND